MKKLKIVLFAMVLTLLPNVHATILPVSEQQLAASCYPSSPMLMSDVCFGQVYNPVMRGGSDYGFQQNDPFSEIYRLMNSLQGNFSSGMGQPLDYSLANPMLWQNTTSIPEMYNQILSPMANAVK